MVDLAETRSAVFVPRHVAVVLDAKAAHLVRAGAQIGDGVQVEIVHHIAGVEIHLDSIVGHLADDLRAGLASAGLASVLLDDNQHAEVASHRPKLPKSFDPECAVAAFGVAKRKYLRHIGGTRLLDTHSQYLEAVRRFGI